MTRDSKDAGRSEFLVFGSPLIQEDEIAEVVESLRSGWIGSGPKVQLFEQKLQEYIGVPYVRCVSSCTAALILALRTLDVGHGDEVLVPAMTFVACANAIEHTGAVPVFVDCESASPLMDLSAAEASVSPRTKAIMAVHLTGRPVNMDRLARLRDKHGIAVIEDAAHALGAEWHGRRIGAHGNLTAYSFYVTKNITTIEGGALATDDAEVAARVERLALHGLSVGAWQRFSDVGFKHYEAVEAGFKYNMTDVQASLGIHQLGRLDSWIDRRAELWETYDAMLDGLPLVRPPRPESGTRHARHLYSPLLDHDAPISRDALLDSLTRHRIGVGVHYRAVHLHPYYRNRYDIDPNALPVATDLSNRTLSLPLSPKVTDGDQQDVVNAIKLAFQAGS